MEIDITPTRDPEELEQQWRDAGALCRLAGMLIRKYDGHAHLTDEEIQRRADNVILRAAGLNDLARRIEGALNSEKGNIDPDILFRLQVVCASEIFRAPVAVAPTNAQLQRVDDLRYLDQHRDYADLTDEELTERADMVAYLLKHARYADLSGEELRARVDAIDYLEKHDNYSHLDDEELQDRVNNIDYLEKHDDYSDLDDEELQQRVDNIGHLEKHA